MKPEDPVVSEPSGRPPRQATEIVHLADGSAIVRPESQRGLEPFRRRSRASRRTHALCPAVPAFMSSPGRRGPAARQRRLQAGRPGAT
jgi:hypothetical protein